MHGSKSSKRQRQDPDPDMRFGDVIGACYIQSIRAPLHTSLHEQVLQFQQLPTLPKWRANTNFFPAPKIMLKSTYKPSASAPPPLPPDWTEHKAPTGHAYYYNVATQESTYTRPSAATPGQTVPALAPSPAIGVAQHPTPSTGSLADPVVANAFMNRFNPDHVAHQQEWMAARRDAARREGENRTKPQPIDKPKRKVAIPGCEPWVLVYTKYGRRFAYNPVKNASYWRIPEKILKAVLELDVKGVRDKASVISMDEEKNSEKNVGPAGDNEGEESSEYEEIEVITESEGEDGDEERPSKRRRTEEVTERGPIEFNEDDIAAQLAAMQDHEDMDTEPDTYDDGGEPEPEVSEEDAMQQLFHDLLSDFQISPYSSWDKIVEEGKIIPDARYLALCTMKARREAFDSWSRRRIQEVKERRAREASKDPRIPYLRFLEEKANTRLYWPEFKRKFRKDEVMRDSKLSDRDREKLYRDYIARLRLPLLQRQKDLANLLKAQTPNILHNGTSLERLPSAVLADLRFASVDAKIRDGLVEAHMQSLPRRREDGEQENQDESQVEKRRDRKRRERALREREEAIAERKRRERRTLDRQRALLKEEEKGLGAAMYVGRKGLLTQLKEDLKKDEPDREM